MLAEMRHTLDGGGSSANDADPFIVELVQAPGAVSAGIMVIPPTGVKGMPGELLDARDAGQLGTVQWTTAHNHKPCLEDVIAVSRDCPSSRFLVPSRLFDLGLKARAVVKLEMSPDALGMREDLR